MTKEQIYSVLKTDFDQQFINVVFERANIDVVISNWKSFPIIIYEKDNDIWGNVSKKYTGLPYLTEISLTELEQLLKAEKENLQVGDQTCGGSFGGPIMVYPNSKTNIGNCSEIPNSSFNPQPHYFNELKQFRSLYELQTVLDLNSYEFDILKRLVRCRKKGQFKEDLKKIKDTVDIYLNEFKN